MYLFELWFSLDICPGVGLLGHMVTLFSVFKGTSELVSIVAAPIYLPTNSVGGFFFCHTLCSIHCRLFDGGHSDLGCPCGSAGKESTCNVGDLGSIPGVERSPGKGKGYPLQYSGLENSMDCIVHGVAKSWTWLSDWSDLIWSTHWMAVIYPPLLLIMKIRRRLKGSPLFRPDRSP